MKIDKIEHNGEKIYLKKDFLGWRVVEPLIEPDTGHFVWKNFFNKKGFLTLGFLLLIILSLYAGFKEAVTNYKTVLDNPCQFCETCYVQRLPENPISNNPSGGQYEINFSQLMNQT